MRLFSKLFEISDFEVTRDSFNVTPLLQHQLSGIIPLYTTKFGALFSADCLNVLPLLQDQIIDTVFADPPFNLGKKYGRQTDDRKPDAEYLSWSSSGLLNASVCSNPEVRFSSTIFPSGTFL
jgi:hypothetical protein